MILQEVTNPSPSPVYLPKEEAIILTYSLKPSKECKAVPRSYRKNHPTSRRTGKAQNHLLECLVSTNCTEKLTRSACGRGLRLQLIRSAL